MKPFYVILVSECVNEDTGEEKAIEAHFKFASKELWEEHCDDTFDQLGEQFNEWLQKNGYKDWYVDDVIETVKSIRPQDAIAPCNVLE